MTVPDSVSDEALMGLAAGGNEEAFVEIYRRRRASLYRFALHMAGSEALADDITQEVFLALLNKRNGFDPARGTLPAYLIGIARKLLRRHFERHPAQRSLNEVASNGFSMTPEPLIERHDPHTQLSSAEAIATVRHAILTLPPRYREAVVLCDLEEMEYEEAAAAADCAVGTIRSRLHRARALLAKKLGPPGPALAYLKTKRCLV